MKRLSAHIIYLWLTLTAALGLTACVDRYFDEFEIPYGSSELSMTMSFKEYTPSLESRAAGDAIKNINSLWIVIYTPEGRLVDKRKITEYIDMGPTAPNVRPDGSASSETVTGHVKFKTTITNGYYRIFAVANYDLGNIADKDIESPEQLKKLSFTWNSNVAANNQMFGWFTEGGKTTDTGSDAPTVGIRRNTSLHAWLRRAASKLTIAFDTRSLNENTYIYLKSVTVKDIPKHCYLGADNNVGQDGYGLPNELVQGETLYFGNAKASHTDPKRDHHNWTSIACGDSIYGLYVDRHPRQLDDNGGFKYVPFETRVANEHSEATEALYFYENMQPDGKEGTVTDKRQDVNGQNAQVSYPYGNYDGSHDASGNLVEGAYTDKGWKDGRPWGSYVEVEAYYECNSGNHPGKGAIIYRFMLGKDTKINYEAERNHHYRLTMKFNKNANDVDFHIDYIEEAKPGTFTPDTAYVSYTYNQPSSMSVRATPVTGYDLVSVEAIILDNEWRPHGDATGTYYNTSAWTEQIDGKNNFATKWTTTEANEGDWDKDLYYKRDSEIAPNTEFGFLSLRKVTVVSQDFGRGDAQGSNGADGAGTTTRLQRLLKNFRRAYFKPQKNPNKTDDDRDLQGPLNYRKYSEIPKTDGVVDRVNETDGSYSFTRTTNPYNRDEVDYVGEIPLYTRAKSLDSWAVYSGANPFYEHERYARVKIITRFKYIEGSGKPKIKGDAYSEESYTIVMQTQRVDNPRAIYRAYNNDEPFMVRLCYGKNTFRQIISQGPWSATIENDPDGLVILSANGQTATGKDGVISGRTRTPVIFTYKPSSKMTDPRKVRCAVITVRYHNNTCIHKILVRQGYAPTALGTKGKYTWSSYNVYNQTELCRSPLSVGSMFRRSTSLDYPILERNNEQKDFGFGEEPSINALFKICVSGDTTWTTLKWQDIPCTTDKTADAFTSINLENHNDAVSNTFRLPTFDDLFEIGIVPNGTNVVDKDYANDYNMAFGICYADSAKTTLFNEDAYSYKDYGNKGVKNKCGVRGVIAYATSDAKNIFFPFGSTGHARRKSRYWNLATGARREAYGLMRYGTLDGPLVRTETNGANNHRPLAWDLPNQMGAGYWINIGKNNPKAGAIAIDFNYGNYNGHYLTSDDLYISNYINNYANAKPDALPIRPIHVSNN